MSIKYKITPLIPDADYDWDVTKGAAIATGHPGLGTPVPDNLPTDKTHRLIKFNPGSTGSQQIASAQKAKPLAFVLNFKYKGQITYKFLIEQNYKNAIREEYKVYGTPFDNLPTYNDFDKVLKNIYHVACPYDAADVPRGANLNKLGDLLPSGKYAITSAYRNPYKNQEAGSNSAKSSHVWSGAFDLKAANGTITQLKELWNDILVKPEFGQVYVESGTDASGINKIEAFLESYIKVTLKKVLVDGSLTYSLPDATNTYAIVWSKTGGWKMVTFSWKETESQEVPTTGEYTFKEEDWNRIARNLHAQDKISDNWGF